MVNSWKYAVISPVKNEARFLPHTIASMVSQKALPIVWMVVDDASTDSTAEIIKACERQYPWVRYLLHPGEAVRKTGSAEIHAFDYGFQALNGMDFDFIVKLDGDLRFDEVYFETLLSRFSRQKKLGIASGIYLEASGPIWEPVRMPGYHAAGASKVVRRECFEQIGGFIAQRGWDTIDEIRAQAKGWDTAHFPDIQFYHLRKEGTGMGQLHTCIMHGEIFYRTGGGPFFFMVKALNRIFRGKPAVLAGTAMIYGYMRSWWKRHVKLVTPFEEHTYQGLLSRRIFRLFKPAFIVRP